MRQFDLFERFGRGVGFFSFLTTCCVWLGRKGEVWGVAPEDECGGMLYGNGMEREFV